MRRLDRAQCPDRESAGRLAGSRFFISPNAAALFPGAFLISQSTSGRHALCCAASDEGEYTKELAKLEMQPKRKPGEAQSEPKPGPPGPATFDAAARTLSIAALPAHATSLVAFRRPAGGTTVEAGVSTNATVSVVSYGPLVPGVSYTTWVEGANSRGRGPKSNEVIFLA